MNKKKELQYRVLKLGSWFTVTPLLQGSLLFIYLFIWFIPRLSGPMDHSRRLHYFSCLHKPLSQTLLVLLGVCICQCFVALPYTDHHNIKTTDRWSEWYWLYHYNGTRQGLGYTVIRQQANDQFLNFVCWKQEIWASENIWVTLTRAQGSLMHYEKKASRWRQCYALGNVLLGNLGSWHSCGGYSDMYHLLRGCGRPHRPLHGNGVPWWPWPLEAG